MPIQHFTTPQAIRLEIKLAAADVHVETVEGGESTVTLEGSPKLLEATTVELLGDRLVIEQRRKSFTSLFGRFDGSLHVEASVPSSSSVHLTTAAGDAKLDGTFGGFELTSASAGVVATGELAGDATVKTVSGDVRLPRVTGDLTCQTVSGRITADEVGGSVSAKSVSGDVRVGTLRDGKVTVHSVSGDVELGIAPGTNVDVDAASASGALHSEIALADRPGDGGGTTVVIRGNTVSGNFRLVRAA